MTMIKDIVTKVSAADFNRDPQHYLAKAAAPGHVIEVTAPTGDEVVILSKEDFEGYKATVELLSRPENARMLDQSIAEIEAGASVRE